MATTTTNFGWDIPQSTDLVKDGATAIAALGQDIDTALVDLKGGTTGQMLTKASNTDLDYSWVTPEIGDITAVTAGTGLSGGGTTGSVTLSINTATTVDVSTAQTLTNKTLTSPVLTTPSISNIDAKGDLLAGTADNTIGKLAVGSNGQYLVADSTASTGLKWSTLSAGGMTLLSTTTLSGTNTDITVTSGYVALYAEIFGLTANTTDGYLQIYPNATSGIGYGLVSKRVSGTNSFDNTTQIGIPNTFARANANNAWVLTIDNPDSSTNYKPFQLFGVYNSGDIQMSNSGAVISNTAITSLRFTNAGGGTWAGGTVKLYGVK
jgi:hypothetical protein